VDHAIGRERERPRDGALPEHDTLLLERVDHIGLNVEADDAAALRCYEKLGFERQALAAFG
jgi:ribosomal protein S18 acetylase RimI-like enzyme